MTETVKWAIGIGSVLFVSVVASAATVITVTVSLTSDVRYDLRELRAVVRTELRSIDGRLRVVEITVGKIEQRFTALERFHYEPQP